MKLWRGKRTRFAVAAILAAALAAAAVVSFVGRPAAADAAAKHSKKKKGPAPFCSAPVVEDYLEPIEKLQPIPAIPEGGAVGFAPPGTTLAATGPQGLTLGATQVGFRLANDAPAGGTSRLLNWIVLERLIRLTDNGRNLHPAGLKRIDLGRLPPGKHRGLTFALPEKPALYSVEITVQSRRGRLLGRFGKYVRVARRTVAVGLKLAHTDNVPAGTYLESCFENHGTASVTPTATNLERFDGGAWYPVAVAPQYSPAQTPIQRVLGPGEAERIGTLVPPDARPGLYKLNASGTTDLGEPVALSAEFGVL